MRYSEHLKITKAYQSKILFLTNEVIYRDKYIHDLEQRLSYRDQVIKDLDKTVLTLKNQISLKGGKHAKK